MNSQLQYTPLGTRQSACLDSGSGSSHLPGRYHRMTLRIRMKTLVRKYLGSIPASQARSADDCLCPTHTLCQVPSLGFISRHFLRLPHDGRSVEIGSHDGIRASNTWSIGASGWTRCSVGPVSKLAERCQRSCADCSEIQAHPEEVSAPGTNHLALRFAGTLSAINSQRAKEAARNELVSVSLTDHASTVSAMRSGSVTNVRLALGKSIA